MPSSPDLTSARTRLTVALAAAVLAIATSGAAQTGPRAMTMPAPGPNHDLARQHLTAARNALSDLTQLPAAGQLAGNPRQLVQQLITDFNAMLTINAGWHASYERIEATLDALLAPTASEPVAGTTGAVGTSGTSLSANAIDPAIRAKLQEFRAHLEQFELSLSPGKEDVPALTPPPGEPAAPGSPAAPATIDDRPDAPPAPTADARDDQEISGVARDVLLHVEALEVILGAQDAAQKAATAAAGGPVVSTETASGSTRTRITGPDVTLNSEQLVQIRAHLKDIRRLLERK